MRNASLQETNSEVRIETQSWESYCRARDSILQNVDHKCRQSAKVWVCAGIEYRWLIYQRLLDRKQMLWCCLGSQPWASIHKKPLMCCGEWACAWSTGAVKNIMVTDTSCRNFLQHLLKRFQSRSVTLLLRWVGEFHPCCNHWLYRLHIYADLFLLPTFILTVIGVLCLIFVMDWIRTMWCSGQTGSWCHLCVH